MDQDAENTSENNKAEETNLAFSEMIMENLNDLDLSKMEARFSSADETLGILQSLQGAIMIMCPPNFSEEIATIFFSGFVYDPGEVNLTEYEYTEDSAFDLATYEHNAGQLFRGRIGPIVKLTEAFCTFDFSTKMAFMFIGFDTLIKSIRHFRHSLNSGGMITLEDQGSPDDSAVYFLNHSPFSQNRAEPFADALQIFVNEMMTEQFIDDDVPYWGHWYDTWMEMRSHLRKLDAEGLSFAIFDIVSMLADTLALKCRLEDGTNIEGEVVSFMESIRVEATQELLEDM